MCKFQIRLRWPSLKTKLWKLPHVLRRHTASPWQMIPCGLPLTDEWKWPPLTYEKMPPSDRWLKMASHWQMTENGLPWHMRKYLPLTDDWKWPPPGWWLKMASPWQIRKCLPLIDDWKWPPIDICENASLWQMTENGLPCQMTENGLPWHMRKCLPLTNDWKWPPPSRWLKIASPDKWENASLWQMTENGLPLTDDWK